MQNPRKSKEIEKAGEEGNGGAMASCKLPWDIVVEILLRLPVKSIVRFKSVCKPWLALFTSPSFISLHLHRTASNPTNRSLLIRTFSGKHDHYLIALFNPKSSHPPLNLNHPFPQSLNEMDLVGSINGLVCLSCPPLGSMIILWNPALNLCKNIRISDYNEPKNQRPSLVSLGLNFDPGSSDYKIISLKNTRECLRVGPRVKVYSANTDSWKEVKPNFPFALMKSRAIVISKGTSYWIALSEPPIKEFLMWFDVQNEEFKQALLPEGMNETMTMAQIVDWEGSLACLMHLRTEEHVDVWGLNDVHKTWSRISRVEVGNSFRGLEMMLHYSSNGVIVAKHIFGYHKLFTYDCSFKRIKYITFQEDVTLSNDVVNYTESLVSIPGMKQVGKGEKRI